MSSDSRDRVIPFQSVLNAASRRQSCLTMASFTGLRFTMVQNRSKISHLIIYCTTSERSEQVSKQVNSASKRVNGASSPVLTFGFLIILVHSAPVRRCRRRRRRSHRLDAIAIDVLSSPRRRLFRARPGGALAFAPSPSIHGADARRGRSRSRLRRLSFTSLSNRPLGSFFLRA